MSDTHTSYSWNAIRLMGMPYNIFLRDGGARTQTIANTSYRTAVIFQVPEDMSLTGATIYCDVDGSSGANKFKFKLFAKDDDAHGDIDVSGTPLAETAEIAAAAKAIQSGSFTSPYAATKGQILAGVFEATTYNSATWTIMAGAAYGHDELLPGCVRSYDSGSSWSTHGDSYPGITVTTDKAYDVGGITMGMNKYYYPNNTDNYRIANKVVFPSETNGLDFHIEGFLSAGYVTYGGQAAYYKVGVWDADGTALVPAADYSYPGDFSAYPDPDNIVEHLFSAPVKMTSGEAYFVGYEYITATGITSLFDTGNASTLRAWPGGAWMTSYIWEGSAWAASSGTLSGFGGGVTGNTAHGRLPMNLLVTDVHGRVQGTPVHGKGDGGETCPSRVKNTRKPGYKANTPKTIARENYQHGWDPYAGGND